MDNKVQEIIDNLQPIKKHGKWAQYQLDCMKNKMRESYRETVRIGQSCNSTPEKIAEVALRFAEKEAADWANGKFKFVNIHFPLSEQP